MAFTEIGANTLDTGYDIENSLRFNDDDSAKLTKTPSGDGDRQKWTVNCWFKRGNLSDGMLFSVGTYTRIQLSSNTIYVQVSNNDSTAHAIQTNRLFRDIAAWYMITVSCDTTQSTASNRLKLYINGVEETSFSTDQRSAITQDCSTATAGQFEHRIGGRASDIFYDGYISEFNFIDGSQLTPSSFGETNDNGVWIPKKYSGSYGTNGFFQEYKQSGTGTDASGIGADTSGNTNHFAVANLAATDITTDTPTNNFCTLNPLWSGAGGTLSEANTKLVSGSSEYGPVFGTIAMTSGKWYWEVICTTFNFWRTGIADVTLPLTTSWNLGYESSPDNAVYRDGGYVAKNASNILSSQPSLAVDETVSVAFDADSGKIWFAQDGTWINSGDPAAGSNEATSVTTGESYYPALSDGSSSTSSTYSFNFGNPPHSISSGNADANGYGNFEYAVPSGFYALCSKNLAEYG